jgi:hypothetical protein
MAEGERRIPAWRRLGLALKKETQSGVTAPEPNSSHDHLQHVPPYDAQNGSREQVHSPIEPAVNGKSSNLGKRKHQHDAAEDGETQKRSKASTPERGQTWNTEHERPVIAQVESATVTSGTSTEAPSDPGQPKGDPNYRKKKAKANKSKRRDNESNPNESLPVQAEVAHQHSTLSPDPAAPARARQTLLASTEKEDSAPFTTPQHPSTTRKANNKDSSGSPSAVDRRKSVAFTPDTKRVDGSSAQDYFKKWTAEQKGADADYFASDVAEFYRNALDEGELRDAKKDEDRQKEKDRKAKAQAIDASQPEIRATPAPKPKPASSASTPPVTSKGKKKDPAYYVAYLEQYYTDREHWKFNKAKQNDIIDNALNIFRIPEAHSEALLEYVSGLKGAGVIDRLHKKCETTLEELEKEESAAKESEMDNPDARKAMHDEALQQRIVTEQKRRKVEGDVEGLLDHPHSDNYIRRLRRKRAEALLLALGRTAPILPAVHTNGINALMSNVAPARDSKKRKRRVDVSSSESSSDSSSSEDESSSSESESDDDSEQSDSDDSDSGSSKSEASAPSRNKKSSSSGVDSDNESDSEQSGNGNSDSNSD